MKRRTPPRRGRSRPQRTAKATSPSWVKLSDEELLDLPLCDLRVTIRGTVLQQRVERICAELADRGIPFRPHFWLSSEWFAPDGVPGAAIPFYLTHPRLMKLEERYMLEVEGGSPEWCMRLLRHEVGHALDSAYRLRRKRKWREAFGLASQPYPEYYKPRAYSRRYVLHLDHWYAQSHPTEDFAETFAVWLTPGSTWRKRYAGWPALKKLECVDELMQEIAGKKPVVVSRERVDPLSRLQTTLRQYYLEKRTRYGVEYPEFYDRDLHKLFGADDGPGKREAAATFLRRVRPQIRRLVARWTGEYQYTIDQVLLDMIDRCQELGLRVNRQTGDLQLEAVVLLTVRIMDHLHGGHHRLVM